MIASCVIAPHINRVDFWHDFLKLTKDVINNGEAAVELSWLQFSKAWTKVNNSVSSFAFFLNATLICQGMPHFPNQSLWLFRNFLGRNFIAQSITTNTACASRFSRISCLAASWFIARRRWAFQASILWIDCEISYSISSRSSALQVTLPITDLTSRNNVGRSSHLSHFESCSWLHTVM